MNKHLTIFFDYLRKCTVVILALGAVWLLYDSSKEIIPRSMEEYTEQHGTAPLRFSAETGFYEDTLPLALEADGIMPEGAAVYYTLDGTEPTEDSLRYSGPIELKAGTFPDGTETEKMTASGEDGPDLTGEDTGSAGKSEASEPASQAPDGTEDMEVPAGLESLSSGGSGDSSETDLSGAAYAPDNPAAGTRVYTVRARICLGEDRTDVQTGTYCVGRGLLPAEGEYIVCIDTDPVNLYDYDTGILVGGRNLDEHDGSKYYGNYMKRGEEWMRPCHVAIFDGSGRLAAEHNAGLSVSGGMSRRLEQKSLNLAFGQPYGDLDEEGDNVHLDFDAFSDLAAADCAHVGRYTHLRLRARSQIPRTFREELAAKLTEESGGRAATEARPGIVFLNGAFYSLAELEPSYSNSLLAHRFDLPDTENIEKKKGKESSVFQKTGVSELFEADLAVPENRAALEAAVDMDDYLLYYAINVLDNNLDWPRNNVEAWRWTGAYDPDRPYTDGRLRFVFFDSDKIYNTDPSIEDDFGTDCLVSMMENKKRGYGSRFRDVMKADVYRDRFITILCDLMNTSFETDHVADMMREICGREEAVYRAFFTQDYMQQIRADQTAALKEEAEYNDRIRGDLARYFRAGQQYKMTVTAGEGVSVQWNNMYLSPGKDYSCSYYQGVPVQYTAAAAPGWRFDHWEVNGVPVDIEGGDDASVDTDGVRADVSAASTREETAAAVDSGMEEAEGVPGVLTVDGSLLEDGVCRVRAVAVPEEGERLVIAEVSSAGTEDWIRLYNAGTTTLDLGRYCISDDPEAPRKFRLPSQDLAPGESCRIKGSGNDSGNALCSCNFSLSRDETLTLTPDEGTDLPGDSIRIPFMSAGCSYGRRDNGSTFWWFDRREDPDPGE